jgi:hypothetical protein
MVSPEDLVSSLVDAYNRKDLEAFLAHYSSECRIVSHKNRNDEGNGIIVAGNGALGRVYRKSFEINPNAKMEVSFRIAQGNTVVDQHNVTGYSDGRETKVTVMYTCGERINEVCFLEMSEK